jgi:hypothetical protein
VDDLNFQENPKDKHDWTAVSQLGAPVGALWQPGHESVTRRNRLGLCLLETTYVNDLVIHHVVFNFDAASPNPKQTNDTGTIQPSTGTLQPLSEPRFTTKRIRMPQRSKPSAMLRNGSGEF